MLNAECRMLNAEFIIYNSSFIIDNLVVMLVTAEAGAVGC